MRKLDIALFGADLAEVSPCQSITTDVLSALFSPRGLANPKRNPKLCDAIELGVPEVRARQTAAGNVVFDLCQHGRLTWHLDHPEGSGFVTYQTGAADMKIIPIREELYLEVLNYLESQCETERWNHDAPCHELMLKLDEAGNFEVVEVSDTDEHDHVYAIWGVQV